ncbi:MAG TPA: hypothetical protein VFV39_12280 [Limnobacter sp.]|nr:hypothetical protein [Limnobacter sp.]
MRTLKILMVTGAATMLSSCDLSQIPGLDGKLSIEDSKAVGAACRHSGRALEDCFAMNPKTHPSGVFEGWRDMNDYMLANQIDVVKPEVKPSAYAPPSAAQAEPPATQEKTPSAATSVETPTATAIEPATERQRWVPKGARVDPPAQAVAEGGATGTPQAPQESIAAPPQSGSPPAAAAPPGKEASPARPWERKKDPKNHT